MPILFLVHGMGDYAPGWTAEIKTTLNETARRYTSFRKYLTDRKKTEFSDLVTLTGVSYDEVFSDEVKRIQSDTGGLEKFTTATGYPGIFDWYAHHAKPDEKDFFWSHCCDVLIYRLVGTLRNAVQVKVMKQLADVLADADGTRASILSHSLGTAVMHDSLARLGTEDFNGQAGLRADGGYRFNALFTLANVSRLVALSNDVYNSCVRPELDGATPAYCNLYMDFHHDFDPFTWAGRFSPTGWGNGYVLADHLHHFGRLNVHSWTHYLDHPAVHIPIINNVLEDVAISGTDEADAIANYSPTVAPECQEALATMKESIEEYKKQIALHPDIATFVAMGSEFFAEAKRAGKACF